MEPASITFIVPAYNMELFVDACLQSIVDSTTTGDQIIIINDGSTDRTEQICKSWEERFVHKIKLINQNNEGLSAARNRGILEATNEYILFMDSDDIVRPEEIQLIRPILNEFAPDIVVCDFFWWHPDRAVDRKRSPRLSHAQNRLLTQKDQFLIETLKDSVLSACNRFFKTKLVRSLGPAPFPVGDAYEEIATVPRITARANSLYYAPNPIFDYRVRPQSITTTKNSKHCLDLAKAMGKFNQELHVYTADPVTKLTANAAAVKFFLAAIRDCGMTPTHDIKLYKNVIDLAMRSLSMPVEEIINHLKRSPDRGDKKAAAHLSLAIQHSIIFIYTRRMLYGWKNFRLSLRH